MDAESLVTALARLQLVASAAILVVLLLRPLALRWCGAGTAYWLWLVVPLAATALLLPARAQVVVIPTAPDISIRQDLVGPAEVAGAVRELAATPPAIRRGVSHDRSGSEWLIALWLLGAGVFLIRSIVYTRKLASSPSTGPALVGVLRPRLLLPQDFETRFSAEERTLILAHEDVHRVSRHTLVNALVEVARCASWFNPLLHWAAMRFRADQELACDTAVIAAHPEARRTYAEALLKAQVGGVYLPMGCVWTSGTAVRLAERIARLSEQLPGRRRRFFGTASIVGIGIAASYATWAQQPVRIITVQQPNAENAAAVPTDSPALETRDSVRALPTQVPGIRRPSTSQAPVGIPAAQSSPGAQPTAVKVEPVTPALSRASATDGTRTLTFVNGVTPVDGVLTVDGVPMVSNSNQANVVDLNIIPSKLLERMAVVTGGASATYGSGAMAGVVNLVLNNRLNYQISPAAQFASESVDEEWGSRKRNEIIASMVALDGVVSTAQIDCRSSSCRVELKWPSPATDESDDQRRGRENRIAMWAQEVSKRSGFLQSDTDFGPNRPSSLSYFTMKDLSGRAERRLDLFPQAADAVRRPVQDGADQLRQPPEAEQVLR